MNRPCSGCGLSHCDGRCFSECEADYPTPAVFAAPLSMMGFAVDVMLVGLRFVGIRF
jgi:hypothetical protein